jgi:hypothetical protein
MPPRSLCSRRVGFTQPTRSAGTAQCAAKPLPRRVGFTQPTRSAGTAQCAAKPLPHPPKGAQAFLGAAQREAWT